MGYACGPILTGGGQFLPAAASQLPKNPALRLDRKCLIVCHFKALIFQRIARVIST